MNSKEKLEKIKDSIIDKKKITGPMAIRFGVSQMCNYNCVMCWHYSPYLKNNIKLKQQIRKESVLNTLKNAHELNVSMILFSGKGEPFTHPDMPQFLNVAFRYNFNILLQTNLSLPLKIDSLAKYFKKKHSLLCVNVMASTASTYKKIHPNQKTDKFYEIINKIKRLTKLGANVRYVYVVNKINFHEIDRAIELNKMLKSRLHLEIMHYNDDRMRGVALNHEEIKNLIEFLSKLSKDEIKNTNIYDFLEQLKFGGGVGKIINRCSIGYMYSVICENGDVYPCYLNTRKMGNIFDTTYKKIWYSKNYRTERARLAEGLLHVDCKQCIKVGTNFKIRNFMNIF